jgi:hypothetical protein
MADIKIGALAGIPIKEREKCNTYNSNQYLDFDGKTLTLCENQKPTRTWGAISGSADYQFKNMQHIADKGPLPEGVYDVPLKNYQKWENLSPLDRIKSYFGRGPWPGAQDSWGTRRVWLKPNESNQMFGRKNLTIHGGSIPESRGCIDLANQMDDFAKWYEDNAKDVPLIVKYK